MSEKLQQACRVLVSNLRSRDLQRYLVSGYMDVLHDAYRTTLAEKLADQRLVVSLTQLQDATLTDRRLFNMQQATLRRTVELDGDIAVVAQGLLDCWSQQLNELTTYYAGPDAANQLHFVSGPRIHVERQAFLVETFIWVDALSLPLEQPPGPFTPVTTETACPKT